MALFTRTPVNGLDKSKDKVVKTTKTYDDEIKELEEEIETLEDKNEKLEEEIKLHKEKYEELKALFEDKNSEINRLRALLDSNTNFLQQTVMELIKQPKAPPPPPVSPAVREYLEKKQGLAAVDAAAKKT